MSEATENRLGSQLHGLMWGHDQSLVLSFFFPVFVSPEDPAILWAAGPCGEGGSCFAGRNTARQGTAAPPPPGHRSPSPPPLPIACSPLIANTWASLPLRTPDEGCVHPTPGVLFFVKETGVSYTRVRGQLLQVGNNSICLHFVFLHFLQHSWGRPLKSLSCSLLS